MRKWVFTLWRVVTVVRAVAAVNVVDDFSTDPIARNRWSFGLGSHGNKQFPCGDHPRVDQGHPTGGLALHPDSTQPSVRLQRPLGSTVTDTADFRLSVRFALVVTKAATDQSFQLAFGLVNRTTTGGNRTGQ